MSHHEVIADGACVGLGLRRGLLAPLAELPAGALDFLEVAPENWIGLGGRLGRQFAALAERQPVYLHGLSLNLGGYAPLDEELIVAVRQFMADFHCPLYSEHLTSCGDDGHLYDLMPIPFTEEAVLRVAERIARVQDLLGQRLVLENASYYAQPAAEMSESEFINAVIARADCELLLDVNNIYVNSINHGYDPHTFLAAMPHERVRYLHVAGHYVEAEDLRIDTHGAAVIDPVWELLREVYAYCGVRPTLLERDFNFPPLSELLAECETIRSLQRAAAPERRSSAGSRQRVQA